MRNLQTIITSIVILSSALLSCNTVKRLKYFENIPDTAAVTRLQRVNFTEPKIQPDDILFITIHETDPTATLSINTGNSPSTAVANPVESSPYQTVTSGYLVGKDGIVELPILGRVSVLNLTTAEAREAVRQKAIKFYRQPTINLRYANFKVTVLGEVNRPASYIIPNERATILDALGFAGDMTVYGRKDNVLLMRVKPDGSREAYRLNLKNTRVLSSPYMYLKQNDVVFVEASKRKAAANNPNTQIFLTVGTSLITLIVVILSYTKR